MAYETLLDTYVGGAPGPILDDNYLVYHRDSVIASIDTVANFRLKDWNLQKRVFVEERGAVYSYLPASSDADDGVTRLRDVNDRVYGRVEPVAPLSFRRKTINGNFGVNQRGVSGTVALSAGEYGHDRWKAGSGGCTYTFATSENVTTLTITAGTLVQVVPGKSLLSGEHVLSWAGTAQAQIDGGGYDDSGLTATATGGTNMTVEFGTGTVSKVQLEPGYIPTEFEMTDPVTELSRCKAFFRILKDIGHLMAFSTTAVYCPVGFSPPMFGTPTLSPQGVLRITKPGTASYTQSAAAIAGAALTADGGSFTLTNFTGLTGGVSYMSIFTDNGNYIEVDAEL